MEILIKDEILYISNTFCKRHINEHTVKKLFVRKISSCIVYNNEKFISFNQIPSCTKDKLPSIDTLQSMLKDQERDSLVNWYYVEFQKNELEKKAFYQNYYATKYRLTPNKILFIARLHAVWERVLELKGGHGWLQNAFKAFSILFPGKYSDYYSFANAVTKAGKHGIESVAFDARVIKEKTHSYDDRLYTWLRGLIALPIKLRDREIAEKLLILSKEATITRIPTNLYEWVKKHRKQILKSNHEIYESRYGSIEAKKREPYAKILGAKDAMTQWQIDGFTIPIWCFFIKEGKRVATKLILFIVLDSYSRMIVGFSIGVSENSIIILKGLNDAISKTGYLPHEILGDCHSFNKTDESKTIKQMLNSFGVEWRTSPNPQFKSIVERTQKHFNEFHLKKIDGHTGQGALTKDKEGRPSQEYIDHYLKPGNIMTKEELELRVISEIESYNNTPLPNKSKSPAQLFKESEKPHAFKVDVFQTAQLFIKAKKEKVSRGQINITRGGIKYEFQLSAELMHKWNNHEVLVRYVDINESIYIFDVKNDMPIGEVKPKVGIHGALADQTEEDRQKLLHNKGRLKGFKTKAKKENTQFAHPDVIHDLNKITTSKDILKEFQESAELARLAEDHGINLQNVVIANQKKNFIPESLTPSEKVERNPVHPKGNHIIKTIDPNEYL